MQKAKRKFHTGKAVKAKSAGNMKKYRRQMARAKGLKRSPKFEPRRNARFNSGRGGGFANKAKSMISAVNKKYGNNA